MTTAAIVGGLVVGVVLAFLTGQLKLSLGTVAPSVGDFLIHPTLVEVPFIVLIVVSLLMAILLLAVIAALVVSLNSH